MRLEKKFNSLWIHRSWEFDLQKGSNNFGGGDIDIDDDYGCPAYHPDPVCATWRKSFSEEVFLRATPPPRLLVNLRGSL